MVKRKTRRRKRAGVNSISPGIVWKPNQGQITLKNPYRQTKKRRKREIEQAKSRKRPRLSTTFEKDILKLPAWHGLKEYKAKRKASRKKWMPKNPRTIGTISRRRTY